MVSQEDFNKQINQLIEHHGKHGFFREALEKRIVTRQIIKKAKFKLSSESIFFYLVSIIVIAFGLTGYTESKPLELILLVPIGVVMFWAVRNHARKVKRALSELSKLAVGIHAEKLAEEQL